ASVVGPLKLAVPLEMERAVVITALPLKVIVPPVTFSVGMDAVVVTVSGPEVKASVEEPRTVSELMVWLAAARAPTVTVKPEATHTLSVAIGTAPVLQFVAVPHWPLAGPVQLTVQPEPAGNAVAVAAIVTLLVPSVCTTRDSLSCVPVAVPAVGANVMMIVHVACGWTT